MATDNRVSNVPPYDLLVADADQPDPYLIVGYRAAEAAWQLRGKHPVRERLRAMFGLVAWAPFTPQDFARYQCSHETRLAVRGR